MDVYVNYLNNRLKNKKAFFWYVRMDGTTVSMKKWNEKISPQKCWEAKIIL